MRIRSFALVLAVALTAALAALAPTASADQPVTTITHVERTFTFPAGPNGCPFPFLVHTEGTFRETVFSGGKDVTHAVDFHVTYTNPANGKSLSTVTINGNDGHITAPGQGTIFAAVGKLAYIADASDVFTPLTILKSTGRQDASQFPATCEGLS